MSSSMNTILVIGGTSGIGEAFARRWFSQGKKLILTGRRQNRLQELEKELPGTRSYVMDNTDLAAIPGHVSSIFEQFPDIDTAWINSGKGTQWSVKDTTTFSDQNIIDELTTNITGPIILARHIIPRLIAKDTTTNFLITSSGLAFTPVPLYPTYPGTKAFVHHFLVSTRAALADTKVNVIEIVPPMVYTDFHQNSEAAKKLPGMTLEDYTNETFEKLDSNKAEDLKEVAAGSAQPRVDLWRITGPGKWLVDNGIKG